MHFYYNNMIKALSQNRKESPPPYYYKLPRVSLVGIDHLSFIGSLKKDSKINRSEVITDLVEKIEQEIIGEHEGFLGPFGWRKYIYADHTASGKSVKCIESFIQSQVLPHYANTHTTVSHTSLQTTIFRDEAREIIKRSVGASEDDAVIFCGSGSTSAVHKLVHSVTYPKSRKLIVFMGPFEHHSNILPWREVAAKIIQVPMSPLTGQVDIAFLRENLQKYAKTKNQLLVGCFSAGSNISGVVTDDIEITRLLHEFGALAFWDYAAAAPHVKIQMNPFQTECKRAFKDAIFFSGHKFLGGPQTPGVLVVKRHVLQNPVPHGVGGGTVLFTTRTGHRYLDKPEDREEGGTPDIVGSIRLGLVFRLRNLIGVENIMKIEMRFCRQVLEEWSRIPEIYILGHSSPSLRLPIISFMIQHPKSGYFLHHNFIVALLNDLFGIQCRGGCMCAGPYAQTLLNINDKLVTLYENCLEKASGSSSAAGMLLKPGFVRISLNFYSTQEQVDFLIEAVKLVAIHGWKMLPYYRFDEKTGGCAIANANQTVPLSSLEMFDAFLLGNVKAIKNPASKPKMSLVQVLQQARQLLTAVAPLSLIDSLSLDKLNSSWNSFSKTKKLRWFMLPYESLVYQTLDRVPPSLKSSRPFLPMDVIGTGSSDFENGATWYRWSLESIPHQLSLAGNKQTQSLQKNSEFFANKAIIF